MKTMTYKCDKCGAEAVGENTIGIESITVTWGQYANRVASGEWCTTCRKKYGLVHVPVTQQRPVPEVEPTLEDMIREIVRKELPQE